MPPNQISLEQILDHDGDNESKTRIAILGCGMMGQEHISYISGYSNLRIDFICDPHEPSLNQSVKVLKEFSASAVTPLLLRDEDDLLQFAHAIDLLVIASPNYLHSDSLLRWAEQDVSILVEKPVAVSRAQCDELHSLQRNYPQARIWVAMEYRYMPAIAKLLQLLPDVGELKMVTIRENRFPFLHKIGDWNRDIHKTGDTLVEKCCHFWDLFRHITGKEVEMDKLRSIVQRGLNYQDEDRRDVPIIDSAYVTFPFHSDDHDSNRKGMTVETIGCLELCMYADGSRHQEEIIVTGTKGRLEAYLPENKVFKFQRPTRSQWTDRTIPPDPVTPVIFDCSVENVHGVESLPTHGGYHYSSTSLEWYYLLETHQRYLETGLWQPQVSLRDGLRAVEIGLGATGAIVNEDG